VDGVIAVTSELVDTIEQPFQIVGRPRRLFPSARRRRNNGASELFALTRVAPNCIPLCDAFLPVSLADESEQPGQLFMQIVPLND
jgi:hypothetical protein